MSRPGQVTNPHPAESVLATGLLLLPMSITVGLGSLVSGRLTARFGSLPPMLAGLTAAAAGAALLATAGPASPLALILAGSPAAPSAWPSSAPSSATGTLSLRVPLLVAVAGYLIAIAVALGVIRR